MTIGGVVRGGEEEGGNEEKRKDEIIIRAGKNEVEIGRGQKEVESKYMSKCEIDERTTQGRGVSM